MLLDLWREYRMTVIFVTHDVDEAVFLSDRVHVLTRRPGRIRTTLDVDLPRPRTLDLLTSPEFMRLKRQAMEALKGANPPATPIPHAADVPSFAPAGRA